MLMEGEREGWLVLAKSPGGSEFALRTVMFARDAQEAVDYERAQGWALRDWSFSAVKVVILRGSVTGKATKAKGT
jgi:hypothetical protein